MGDKLSDTADAHAQSPQLCESKDAGRERPADVIVRDVPRIEQQRFHEMRHRLARLQTGMKGHGRMHVQILAPIEIVAYDRTSFGQWGKRTGESAV